MSKQKSDRLTTLPSPLLSLSALFSVARSLSLSLARSPHRNVLSLHHRVKIVMKVQDFEVFIISSNMYHKYLWLMKTVMKVRDLEVFVTSNVYSSCDWWGISWKLTCVRLYMWLMTQWWNFKTSKFSFPHEIEDIFIVYQLVFYVSLGV
jgi:hypothetical protein